jgi:F0F1-type ATP synthase assembly protein I
VVLSRARESRFTSQRLSFVVLVVREGDQNAESEWARQEEATAQEALRERLIAQQDDDLHPSRNWIHRGMIAISTLTGLTAAGMVLGQVLGFLFQVGGPIQYFLRFYVVLLCLIVILNECECTKFIRQSGILKHWVSRGLLYAFIGLLGLEQMDTASSRNQDQRGFEISMEFVGGVAWVMVACGVLYFVMGSLCLHLVLIRLRNDYQERLQRAMIIGNHLDRRSPRAA